MDDARIVELYFARNESAILETEAKYGNYCLTVARNILLSEEDSKECLNDALMRVWNSIPPTRPNSLKAFIAKITRNLAFNRYRENTSKKRGGSETEIVLSELEECVPHRENTESEYSVRELGRTINKFLYTLSERDCDIFLKRYFYVVSISELAKEYGIKENQIRTILSRTKQKLKLYLEEENFYI
ncbi:MAG: sigma-70 family RNA polymerase sigma factor [Ruminococcaceae bacterium]|nr:sigma-70 family RNA polymerase sigma factor [Oscillospiraceae bacterium]